MTVFSNDFSKKSIKPYRPHYVSFFQETYTKVSQRNNVFTVRIYIGQSKSMQNKNNINNNFLMIVVLYIRIQLIQVKESQSH